MEDEEPSGTDRSGMERGYENQLHLISSLTHRCRAALREQLRGLSHEDFMSLIRKVYAALEGGIHELQVQNAIQKDVLDSLRYAQKSKVII